MTKQSMIRNKKNIFNILMVAVMAVILMAGVLTAGYLRGWFGGSKALVTNEDGTEKVLEIIAQSKKGSVHILRSGISMELKKGDVLRDGDRIETGESAAVTLVSGENTFYLDEKSSARLSVKAEGTVLLELEAGGAFHVVSEPFELQVMDTRIIAENAVFSASAPYGSASVHILEENVTAGDREAKSGQAVSILKNDIQITELAIQSLNSFELNCMAQVDKSRTLCFNKEQVNALIAQRQETALAQLPEGTKDGEKNDLAAGEPGNTDPSKDSGTPGNGNNGSTGNDSGVDNSGSSGSGNSGSNGSGNGGGSGSNGGNSGTGGNGGESNTEERSCTIRIVCDTILDNMDELEPGKDIYVPNDGVILPPTRVTFSEGETVFEVLKRVCDDAGIQLEYAFTPGYNSYYIEGINHLYQFDCTSGGGWMFKVNGWFPNYGCSAYTLKKGDDIVWCYTCNYGEDVGGSVY